MEKGEEASAWMGRVRVTSETEVMVKVLLCPSGVGVGKESESVGTASRRYTPELVQGRRDVTENEPKLSEQ